MERRLYFGIAWPGLCISLVFGVALIIVSGFPDWLHAKLAFVLVLVVYHLWCGHLRKLLLKENCSWNGTKFRLFNEIPTLLLFSIVFIVVFKSAISWNVLLLILVGLILVIGGAVNLRVRRRKWLSDWNKSPSWFINENENKQQEVQFYHWIIPLYFSFRLQLVWRFYWTWKLFL